MEGTRGEKLRPPALSPAELLAAASTTCQGVSKLSAALTDTGGAQVNLPTEPCPDCTFISKINVVLSP